ncbi:MAG: hypothetical protein WD971_11020 [Pirellulales bacterium]
MRYLLTTMFSAAILALVSIGCGPRPVAAPDSDPAFDVDVNRDGVDVERDGNDVDAAVDVQVGGGQGVQVEVDRGGQGTDIHVGGKSESN